MKISRCYLAGRNISPRWFEDVRRQICQAAGGTSQVSWFNVRLVTAMRMAHHGFISILVSVNWWACQFLER